MTEQKRALILYAADNDITLPTSHQWSLLERVVAILSPIERATRDVSAEASCASDVIPMYIAISRALRSVTDDSGVQTMKKDILKEIDTRFADVMKEPLYAVATLVDPRYRGKLLAASDLAAASKRLTELMENGDTAATGSAQPDASRADVVEPVAKRPRLDEASPLDLLEAELQADTAPSHYTAADEVAEYMRQPNIQRQLDPLQWWSINQSKFPRVANVAQRYLSSPSTSVPSERLFSSAGDLYSDSRNRLSGRLADKLLFIKHNLQHI